MLKIDNTIARINLMKQLQSAPDETPLLKDEVALIVGVHVTTIEHRNGRKNLPPAIKIGGRVRYRWGDLKNWIASQEVEARA